MSKLTVEEIRNQQDDNEVDLSARQLTEAPSVLHLVPRLTHVDLSSNKIMLLPNAICLATKLIKLDLANNKIHHLPHEFGNLTKLQFLNLYNNDIEALPLSFANLKSLKWLDLKKNPLNEKLQKATGNCGNEKECKLAAQNVVKHMAEEQKFFQLQKEKEKKVLEKIQKTNEEQKIKKWKEQHKGNAKTSGGAREGGKAAVQQQAQQQRRSAAENEGRSKRSEQAKKSVEKVQPKRGFVSRAFRFFFYLFYYITLATFGAATVAILLNCYEGGKNIPGSRPLCSDLTKLSKFEKPSALFLTNIRNTYRTVFNEYNKQIQPYTSHVTKQVRTSWKQFSKTSTGKQFEKYVYTVHTWVVEKFVLAQRFVQKKHNEIVAWYKKDGHKQFGQAIEGFKVGLNMVFEVVKDVALSIFAAIEYLFQRASTFFNKWLEGGFQAALKTLN